MTNQTERNQDQKNPNQPGHNPQDKPGQHDQKTPGQNPQDKPGQDQKSGNTGR
jgi:hypothetical protein